MDNILPFFVWGVLIILILSAIIVVGFGIRNLIYGKVSMTALAIVALPIVLAVVLGSIQGWVEGAILTTAVMLVLSALALVGFGARGLIS